MKESKLIEMKRTLDAQSRIIEHILNEISNIRDLAVGTLECLKIMDKKGYEKAINKIKEDIVKESSKTEKAKSLETSSD